MRSCSKPRSAAPAGHWSVCPHPRYCQPPPPPPAQQPWHRPGSPLQLPPHVVQRPEVAPGRAAKHAAQPPGQVHLRGGRGPRVRSTSRACEQAGGLHQLEGRGSLSRACPMDCCQAAHCAPPGNKHTRKSAWHRHRNLPQISRPASPAPLRMRRRQRPPRQPPPRHAAPVARLCRGSGRTAAAPGDCSAPASRAPEHAAGLHSWQDKPTPVELAARD